MIYTEYVILLCFVINHYKTLLISQIIITNLCLSHKFIINSFCDIFKVHFFAADTESSTFSKALAVQTQQTKKRPTQSKHWKTGLYLGSADRASYYYNIKVLVYNVYSVNNPYSYSELSIFVQFFELRETHAEVVYYFFVIYLIEVSYIKISHNFWICAVFFISVTIFWGSQRIP